MNPDTCPTCKQPWPERRGRICSECQLPIGAHHRYHFVGSSVRHRDCEDPKLESTWTKMLEERFQQTELLTETDNESNFDRRAKESSAR